MALGVAGGVAAVGHAGDESGSFGSTFLWTLADLGVVVACTALAQALEPRAANPVMAGEGRAASSVLGGVGFVALLATPIVAVVAFNRTRRYDAGSAQIGSLVNVSGGHASIGLPIPIRTDSTTGFSLASGSF